jgi:SAM-dependent methyltransferase
MMYRGMHKSLGDDFIYIDVRTQEKHDYGEYKNAIPEIKPMILASMAYLPFRDKCFDVIVCDPPHLDAPLSAFMAEKYGTWNYEEMSRTIKAANVEFARVLRDGGVLVLKILFRQYRAYADRLSNFIFFLPIEFPSKSHLSSERTAFFIGVKR